MIDLEYIELVIAEFQERFLHEPLDEVTRLRIKTHVRRINQNFFERRIPFIFNCDLSETDRVLNCYVEPLEEA